MAEEYLKLREDMQMMKGIWRKKWHGF